MMAAAAADEGFRLGLIATAFSFGLRHGIDWDHIAAIADLTSGQQRPRRALLYSSLYALGHASVVFVLGALAIMFAEQLPASVDSAMERVVGLTLLLLGGYVVYGLLKHGRDFRMRSRWMLVAALMRRGAQRLRARRERPDRIVIEHDHEHEASEPHPGVYLAPGPPLSGQPHGASGFRHRHSHRHEAPMPQDPFGEYGKGTAFGIGMIHGIGAETPTQVLIFLTAAGAGGEAAGLLLLACFVAGLVTSNTVIAVCAAAGLLRPSTNFRVYAAVSLVVASLSIVLGALFLFGQGGVLPAIFAG